MEQSRIFLNFFIIITMVFIASANDGGYKILNYDEDIPAYPWQRVDVRDRIPHLQRRDDTYTYDNPIYELEEVNGTVKITKKNSKSNFEDKMADLNNFGRGSAVKIIYGRVPSPVILVKSYDKPKH